MVTERGPSARRGRQFSQHEATQLLSALTRAAVTLRKIHGVARSSASTSPELDDLRRMSKEELEQLRRTTSSLLSDLRAELRRRGHL